jgi:hypothetical protein
MFIPFLKKDNQELPDSYTFTIHYLDGSKEEFEAASHTLSDKLFEFVTKDNLISWTVVSSIKRIEFDKQFSKIVAIKGKMAQQAAEKAKN